MDKYKNMKLENQLCFPIYALSREIIKSYKPFLDEFNLTYTQYITMLVIWEDEKITFKNLGKRLYLDSGTLTPVLKKLESMELILKYRTKEDDRVVMVELTEKGRALKDKMSNIPEKMFCNSKLSVKEAMELREIINKVLQNYNK